MPSAESNGAAESAPVAVELIAVGDPRDENALT